MWIWLHVTHPLPVGGNFYHLKKSGFSCLSLTYMDTVPVPTCAECLKLISHGSGGKINEFLKL